MQTIVIAGCGFGGIDAAVNIKRYFHDSARVIAINNAPYHTLNGALPEIISEKLSPTDVNVPLQPYFDLFGVEFVKGSVDSIDPKKKKVIVDGKKIAYDALVLDLGAQTHDFGIPGIKEHAFTVKPLMHAVALSKHIRLMFVKYHDLPEEKRQQAMTFVIGGSGLTGVEVATEIYDYTRRLAKEYGVHTQEISIHMIEAAPRVCMAFKQKAQQLTERVLLRKGIKLHCGDPVTKVTKQGVHFGNGKLLTDTFVWTGGFKSHAVVQAAKFAHGRDGSVIVNEYLQTRDYPNVFASGDNAGFDDPKLQAKATRTALTAVNEQAIVVQNVIALLEDKPLKKFTPKDDYSFYVTTGGNNAIWMYKDLAFHHPVFFHLKKQKHGKYAKKYFYALNQSKQSYVEKHAADMRWD